MYSSYMEQKHISEYNNLNKSLGFYCFSYTNLGKDKADKKMYSKIFNFALDYLMTNVRKS